MSVGFSQSVRLALFGAVAFVMPCICVAPVQAQLSPDNPRVQQSIARARTFLESQTDARAGAKSLMGLALIKSGSPADHPKVLDALKAIKAQVDRGAAKITLDIYSTGTSLMFLVALNPSRHRYEIKTLVESLHLRQKSAGAWGYPRSNEKNGESCDTSMTQYAVLGLWEAEDQAGVTSPSEVWDRVARWLLKTQDPSGGFGYQGKLSYEFGERVKQSGVKHSLTVAAMSSIYIVKDRVGYRRLKREFNDGLPAAFEAVEEAPKEKIKTDIPLREFGRVIGAGNRWVEENYDVEDLKNWVQYSLYALERYESLRVADAEASKVPLPKSEKTKWYNKGARYLLKNQGEDGQWESNAGAVPGTCFGILFLLGSTRKTLDTQSAVEYRGGTMAGGKGLPSTDRIRLRNGRVVALPLKAPLPQVLKILENPEDKQYAAAVEALADATEKGKRAELRQQRPQLERLVLSNLGEVSQLAVRALVRAQELNAVPVLIRAIEEGNAELMWEASEGLARLSRNQQRFGLTPKAEPAARRAAAEQWRKWFGKLRPAGASPKK